MTDDEATTRTGDAAERSVDWNGAPTAGTRDGDAELRARLEAQAETIADLRAENDALREWTRELESRVAAIEETMTELAAVGQRDGGDRSEAPAKQVPGDVTAED